MSPDGVTPETVGERLRRILGEKEMSQAELARQLAEPGASANRVNNIRRQVVAWANGKVVPDDTSAERLAEVLGQPAGTFTSERLQASASAQLAHTARALEETAEVLAGLLGELLPLLRQQADLVDRMQKLVAELSRRSTANGQQ